MRRPYRTVTVTIAWQLQYKAAGHALLVVLIILRSARWPHPDAVAVYSIFHYQWTVFAAAAAATAAVSAAGPAAVGTPGEPTNWAINIANIFLAPFGIGSSDSSVSAEGTKGDLLLQTQTRLPQSLPIYVACRDNRCVRAGCFRLRDRVLHCTTSAVAVFSLKLHGIAREPMQSSQASRIGAVMYAHMSAPGTCHMPAVVMALMAAGDTDSCGDQQDASRACSIKPLYQSHLFRCWSTLHYSLQLDYIMLLCCAEQTTCFAAAPQTGPSPLQWLLW